jgi:hypothetical protein
MTRWLLLIFLGAVGLNLNAVAFAAEADGGEYIRLGRQALTDNHPDRARGYFRAALRAIGPHPSARADVESEVSALSGLGFADLWLGADREARWAYSKGLDVARNEGDRRTLRVGLARALIDLGQPRRAYELLRGDTANSQEAALQSSAAASLLGWNTASADLLREAAPTGRYTGPVWRKNLYDQTGDTVALRTRPAVDVDVQYSDDSDHNLDWFYTATVSAPGPRLGDGALGPTMWQGQFQQLDLSVPGAHTRISAATAGVAAPLSPDWDYSLRAGAGVGPNWTYGTVTGRLAYHPSDYWGVEVNVDRQPVETVQSIQDHVLFDTVSVSGFGSLPDVGTISTSYVYQNFSDGNERNSFVARVTPVFYSVSGAPISLGVQGYYRYYEDGRTVFDGYFNPAHYSVAIGYLIYKEKFSPRWTFEAHAGYGSQTVNSTTTPVDDVFAELRGSVSSHFQLVLKGGYTQVAGVNGGGPGYNSHYVEAEIVAPF